MGISNEFVKEHMNALFGETRGNLLREKITGVAPADRENIIIEELAAALKEMGGKFVLPFRFVDEKGTRTSHHLFFVSKNVTAYTIMKGIMAGESSKHDQGVGSLEYNPVDEKYKTLFPLTQPLSALEGMLLRDFQGRTLSAIEIFDQHHVGTPYIFKNYQDVLKTLESAGSVQAQPPAASRRKNTFSKDVIVTFPGRP